jgi:hypothetical protein
MLIVRLVADTRDPPGESLTVVYGGYNTRRSSRRWHVQEGGVVVGLYTKAALARPAACELAARCTASCWVDIINEGSFTTTASFQSFISLYTSQSWADSHMAPMVLALRSQSSDSVRLRTQELGRRGDRVLICMDRHAV